VTLDRIGFSVWLQITGPTFATMVFGFALLWNGQQVLAEQQLEHSRSLGRLEGVLDGMQRLVQGLDRSVARVESSITRVEGSITALDARIDKLGTSVDRLSESIGTLGTR